MEGIAVPRVNGGLRLTGWVCSLNGFFDASENFLSRCFHWQIILAFIALVRFQCLAYFLGQIFGVELRELVETWIFLS